MIPATITANSVNLFIDGRMRTIASSHMNYQAVLDALRAMRDAAPAQKEAAVATVRSLVDIPSFIKSVTEGRVTVFEDRVHFDGQPTQGVICERLIMLMQGGHDIKPLARFLDRLMNNPLESARNELYLWLETSSLPITEDGCFLAFKKVDEDYRSYHAHPDGTREPHNIGDKPVMPRENVDPDRNNECSRGYHFCSFDYLSMYNGDRGHVMVVKVAPEDVVAIPRDYSNQKGRTFQYEVVDEVPSDEAQQFFRGTPVTSDYDVPADPEPADEPAPEVVQDDVVAAPKKKKKKGKARRALQKIGKALQAVGKIMDRDGKGHSPGKIATAVAKWGQRVTAEKFNIPRATLQRAIKKRKW